MQWKWIGDPFKEEDDRTFYFAIQKGKSRFMLGDTIEVTTKTDIPLVGEIESLFEDKRGKYWVVYTRYSCYLVCTKFTSGRYYSWQDIYDNVKDYEQYRAQISPDKLDRKVCFNNIATSSNSNKKHPELFVSEATETAAINAIKRRCWVLPKREYENYLRLQERR